MVKFISTLIVLVILGFVLIPELMVWGLIALSTCLVMFGIFAAFFFVFITIPGTIISVIAEKIHNSMDSHMTRGRY